MNVLTILHISDFHFYEKTGTTITIDKKDNSLSPAFISAVTNSAEDQFLSDIVGFKPINGFDFIACTGDLGNNGIKKNIKMGAKYLERLAKILNISPQNVFISPGNHDLRRERKPENELKDFCDICDDLGFSYADYNSSTLKPICDIPVLILNTCLGGTEKAYYGYKKEDWDKIKNALKKDEKILKEDLDIPAIGNNQLSTLKQNICENCSGDFSIILMHHNPLPTNNMELKPYANIIDAGPFISYCMETQKHIIVLHGHTHCEAELTVAKYDSKGNQNGWITALGKEKFHHAVTVIEIWLTNDNDFIKAYITDIVYVASKYNTKFKSILRSTAVPKHPKWIKDLLNITKKKRFCDFAHAIQMEANEDLAIELLQNEGRLIDINKYGSTNYNKWSIGSLI